MNAACFAGELIQQVRTFMSADLSTGKPDVIDWKMLQESTWLWIGLIVAIVVLAVVVQKIRALFWGDEDPAGDVQQLVEGAEEMRRTGALTEAEFRSIQSRAARRAVEVTLAQRGQALPASQATSTERSEQWGSSQSEASGNRPTTG